MLVSSASCPLGTVTGRCTSSPKFWKILLKLNVNCMTLSSLPSKNLTSITSTMTTPKLIQKSDHKSSNQKKQFGFPIALASGGTASRGKRGAHPQLRCHGSNTWKGPGAVECGFWDLHQTRLLWKHVSLACMMHIQSNVYLCNLFIISLSDDVSFPINLPWSLRLTCLTSPSPSIRVDLRWCPPGAVLISDDLDSPLERCPSVEVSAFNVSCAMSNNHHKGSVSTRTANGVFFPNCSTDVFKLFSEGFHPFFPTTPEFQLSLPWPRSVTPGIGAESERITKVANTRRISCKVCRFHEITVNHRCSVTYHHCLSLTFDLPIMFKENTREV